MHLDSGAEVKYKTMTLTSGMIDFDAKKETMSASGDPSPVLIDVEDEIRGNSMNYHLPSEKGEIIQGMTEFENGFYQGEDVWKMGENVLAVDKAIYTTCDLDPPHYHFSCKNMKIYLDDKMVARPVVFKIRNIPVFALPFYMASLKKKRHSGFLLPNLELGVDDNRGRFIRNLGYYWAPNDHTDVTATFDFYPQQDRIVSYLSARYNLRYRFDGRAAVKFNRDVPRDLKETAVELEHRQTFSETMRLTGSARFVSSSSIYRNIDDAQRLNRELQSHATLTKQFSDSRNLRVDLRRRENLDTESVNETIPTIDFTQPSRPITGRKTRDAGAEESGGSFLDEVYYSLNGRFVRQRDKTVRQGVIVDADSTVGNLVEDETRAGSKVNVDVRSTIDLLRYLRISPSLNTEGVWFDEDEAGNSHAYRATYSTALTGRTEVYGTFLKGVGAVQGFRHVIRPNVSWRWAPKFSKTTFVDSTGTRRNRFPSFGGIGGATGQTNSMSFSVNNLIQTKLLRGEQERRYDLFNLQNSIRYDFLAEERGNKPLSNLSSSVTTRARLSSSMFKSFRLAGAEPPRSEPPVDGDAPRKGDDPVGGGWGRPGSGVGGGGDWSVDVSHTATRTPRREGRPGGASSSLVFNSRWSPTANWRVTFNTQYDLQNGDNTTQSWSVQRMVHRWELSFDRRLLGGEWQYYFRISLTDIPDIKVERGDRFQGLPGTGGLGGLF
jgi:hypothetical protein